MFESLKKKFSRTSEKLEEELIEEAEAEDNLQEESGSRFSFFSFGRKKDEKKEEEVVEEEENLLPEADEIEEVPEAEEVEEIPEAEDEEIEEEPKEEKKSRFWHRNKNKDEPAEETEEVAE